MYCRLHLYSEALPDCCMSPCRVHAAQDMCWLCRMPANKGLGAGKYDNLYTAMHAAMRPQGAQGARDITIRAVEQGARLLAAPPHGVRVVLQMPRGNLEGICPRVLVLAGIAAHLQARGCIIALYQQHSDIDGNIVSASLSSRKSIGHCWVVGYMHFWLAPARVQHSSVSIM